jgi:hypothetical protein
MKIKALVVAVLAAAAAPSFALAPSAIGAVNPVLALNGSGATAVDKQLAKFFDVDVCPAGTMDSFKDAANKYFAYTCTISSANVAGLSGTFDLVVRKNSAGGSFNGVGPVATAGLPGVVNEEQMVLSAANCTESAPGSRSWTCTTTTLDTTASVDFGISDVEPALWAKLSKPFPAANIVSAAMNLNTFGAPVTKALRDALQVAQGLPAGSELPAEQPNLSRSQVASLLQGAIPSWAQFYVGTTPLNATAGITPPAFPKVQVCRRVADSGTQAQADVFFNNFPCSKTSGKTASDNTSFSSTSTGSQAASNLNPGLATRAAIHEHESSGGVADCLNALNDANMWAIGIQSTERSSAKYRFVKIDGFLPTLENVANNNYGDAYTATIQWRVAPALLLPSADKLKVLTKIRDDASKAAILAQINASFSQPNFGGKPVGILALPYKPTSVANPVYSATNPVATAARETSGTAPDSCKTPVIAKNSVISGL